MLWVFKEPQRTVSMRRFFWAPKTYAKMMGKKYLPLYAEKFCLSKPVSDFYSFVCLRWCITSQVTIFSHVGTIRWTSTKQRIKCLAQGHNTVTPLVVRLKPATLQFLSLPFYQLSLCTPPYIKMHFRLDFIIKANTMSPDQTAHLIWVHIVCWQVTNLYNFKYVANQRLHPFHRHWEKTTHTIL